MSISTSIEVDRPPADVFTYVTDPSRFVEWQNGVVRGHTDTDGPPSVGDRCVAIRRIGFAERPVVSEITHIDPPRTWAVRGIDGPIRAAVAVTVDPLDGNRRARVTVEIDFAGHGIGRMLVPAFVRAQARREMPANMRRLKERLEGSRGGAGSTPRDP